MMKDCPDCTIVMSLDQFLTDVLFVDAQADLKRSQAKVAEIHFLLAADLKKQGLTEKDYSIAWEKADAVHRLCPGYFLHLSEDKYEDTDDKKGKIDGSLILDTDRDQVKRRIPYWALQQLSIEFKRGKTSLDPFDDRKGQDPDAEAQTRRTVRGQIMDYAERVFAYQQRTALFMLLVNGPTFRVMRWDRSGVIVTEAVNYIETCTDTGRLLQVLYAFSKLSPEKQGRDMTATLLSPNSCGWKRMDALAEPCPSDLNHEERWLEGVQIHPSFLDPNASSPDEELDDGDGRLHQDPTCPCQDPASMHTHEPSIIPVFTYVRDLFRRSLKVGFPRYAIKVDGKVYLVAMPVFIAFGMVGRGTKGFVALEWKTQRLVWFKDSWRPYYHSIDSEGHILDELNKAEVEGVPTALAHEDVHNMEGNPLEQQTETSEYSPLTGDKKVRMRPTASRPFDASDFAGKRLNGGGKQAPKRPAKRTAPIAALDVALHQTWGGPDPVPSTSQSNILPSPDFADSAPGEAARGVTVDSLASLKRGTKRSAEDVQKEDARLQGIGLRHLVHTRLIVREICLPFTDFTSSKQLVRIIFECLTAHAQAYTRCKYMHRDVSAGNLLILPTVQYDKESKRHYVYWQGILADWELAKHSNMQVALQPERTGTWHFMSVSLLTSKPGTPTVIPDEVEAFVHVLVYGAVRRMKCSLDAKALEEFHRDYFSGFSRDSTGKITAPFAKRQSVKSGKLHYIEDPVRFSLPVGDSTSEHVLNTVIASLFETIKARYAVQAWEQHLEKLAGPKTPARQTLHTIVESGVKPLSAADPLPSRRVRTHIPPNPLPDEHRKADLPRAPSLAAKEPTEQMYKHAKGLEKHTLVLDILERYLYDAEMEPLWPQRDILADESNAGPSATATATNTTQLTSATDQAAPGDTGDTPLTSEETHPAVKVPDAMLPVSDASFPDGDVPEAGPSEVTEATRPAKRTRRAPAAPTQTANEAPARRVTRSRSAVNVTAQAAPAVAAAPQTNMRRTRSMNGIVARRPGQGNATATTSAGSSAGTGARITRSTSRRSLRGDGAGDANAAGGSRGSGRGGRGGRGRAASGRR